MHKIKDLFIEFLLDNDCYSQAQINFLEQSQVTIEEYLEEFDDKYEEFLNNGFTWTYTPEGWVYWNKIDDLWRELLASKKFEIFLSNS